MIARGDVLQLVNGWTKNQNLVKHMLAVEAEMKGLAKHFGENEENWGLVGLIHDADYEKWPEVHPKKTLEELKKRNAPDWLYNSVERHAWGYNGITVKPGTKLEWALYTCDDLSGFIVACALVRPDKKLSSVTIEMIMKKWKEKSFAAGVKREHVELCEEKLGIKLGDFMQICLSSLQKIAPELGL